MAPCGGGPRRGLGEPAVDVDVAVPPLAVVDRLDDDVVVQRPQGGVGEALVVLGDVLGGQPHRMQLEVVLDDGLLVGVGDTPGQPIHAPRRLRSSGSSAVTRPPGLRFQRRGAVGQPLHVDRQPVGDHDEVGVALARERESACVGRLSGAHYASSFAGPIPSMDRKTRHSSASVA